jgi:hypothetical protein
MITIKELDNNTAKLHIEKGTPHFVYLLGLEMIIEAILKEVPTMSIDDVLYDLKRIYERDNLLNKK